MRPRNFPVADEDDSVVSQLSESALFFDLDIFSARGSDALEVILHVPQEPMMSNGKWNEEVCPQRLANLGVRGRRTSSFACAVSP